MFQRFIRFFSLAVLIATSVSAQSTGTTATSGMSANANVQARPMLRSSVELGLTAEQDAKIQDIINRDNRMASSLDFRINEGYSKLESFYHNNANVRDINAQLDLIGDLETQRRSLGARTWAEVRTQMGPERAADFMLRNRSPNMAGQMRGGDIGMSGRSGNASQFEFNQEAAVGARFDPRDQRVGARTGGFGQFDSRMDARYDPRFDARYDQRVSARYDPRYDARYDQRFDARFDQRSDGGFDSRFDPRFDSRFGGGVDIYDVDPRMDPRFDPRFQNRGQINSGYNSGYGDFVGDVDMRGDFRN